MDADFCVEALKEAIAKYGKPEIMNSPSHGLQASRGQGAMPCSGSLKYECIYLKAFETGSEARIEIGKWLAYYNAERPHSTHGILTPDEAYERKTEPMSLAA